MKTNTPVYATPGGYIILFSALAVIAAGTGHHEAAYFCAKCTVLWSVASYVVRELRK